MTKRFVCATGGKIEAPDVDAFLRDVIEVCHKHGMCLGHEDDQGAFQVYREIFPTAIDWLMDAQIADSSVRKS